MSLNIKKTLRIIYCVTLCTDEVACADPELCKQICGNTVGCSDIAYAKLVMELLPGGKKPMSVFKKKMMAVAPPYPPLRDTVFLSCVCPPRPAWSNDGCNDCCSHVLSDLHLQQFQHHLHHGHMEEF